MVRGLLAFEQGPDPGQVAVARRYLQDHEQAGVLDEAYLEQFERDRPCSRVIDADRHRAIAELRARYDIDQLTPMIAVRP